MPNGLLCRTFREEPLGADTLWGQPNAWPCLGQDHLQCGLAALKWIMPQVVAVQLDQVEGVKENILSLARW
jgi:hypothetical protein